MKISMNLSFVQNIFGIERSIELCARAGFDAFDLSLQKIVSYNFREKTVSIQDHPLLGEDRLAVAAKIRALADSCGIVCNQTHAPFPIHIPELRAALPWALEISGAMGADCCIIHPANNDSAEENAKFFRSLLPFAKKYGVKIATENMWNWNREADHAHAAACSHHDDFLAHIEAVGDDYLVACLDIGHAEMKGLDTSSVAMIHTLGPHLQATHFHDNDKWHDSHDDPFKRDIDFAPIMAALKETGYKGDLTLEIDSGRRAAGISEADALEELTHLAGLAARLRDMFLNA